MDEKEGRKIKSIAIIVGTVIVVECLIFFGILYSGVIDIAASKPHLAFTEWVLETGRDRSVAWHASSITAPAVYSDFQFREGFKKFDKLCVVCHPPPGQDRSEASKGMRPQPPDLKKTVKDLSDAEIFWIVKNGIKFTGMPSFGKPHTDDGIWELVAFVKKLPEVSPSLYSKLHATLR